MGMAIGVKYIEQTFDDDAKKEVSILTVPMRSTPFSDAPTLS
jgi:hypothetical protein